MVCITIGSEQGCCGDFNETLLVENRQHKIHMDRIFQRLGK